MAARAYKKYMKKNIPSKDYSLLKLFIISFSGMLLLFTFIIKSFSPTVDVTIGDYKQDSDLDNTEEINKVVDDRLSMIQTEDQGKDFSSLVKNAEEKNDLEKTDTESSLSSTRTETKSVADDLISPKVEPVYKVFIGTYTSSEQAKVAKDIILETGSNLNPIIKCIGSNNYTLQVGIFKNKNSAEALLYTIQQNHLPGRIVQEN